MKQNSYDDIITSDLKDDPEIKEIAKEMDALEERLFKVVMKKKYGVDAGFLPDDPDHVLIDGVLYDDEEFIQWLIDQGAISGLDEEIAKA